jgi:hypothetical protein
VISQLGWSRYRRALSGAAVAIRSERLLIDVGHSKAAIPLSASSGYKRPYRRAPNPVIHQPASISWGQTATNRCQGLKLGIAAHG